MSKHLVQASIFDPLIPYLQNITWSEVDRKNISFEVSFILPENLVINETEIQKYFSSYKLKSPRPEKITFYGITTYGPKPPRTLTGTLKSKNIGYYLLSKMK